VLRGQLQQGWEEAQDRRSRQHDGEHSQEELEGGYPGRMTKVGDHVVETPETPFWLRSATIESPGCPDVGRYNPAVPARGTA
jgi:hypothetical protein